MEFHPHLGHFLFGEGFNSFYVDVRHKGENHHIKYFRPHTHHFFRLLISCLDVNALY